MLDPIVGFFQRVFSTIGRGIGVFFSWLLAPFVLFGVWYRDRGWIIKGPIGIGIVLLFGLYVYFVWQTQVWTNFNTDYVNRYNLAQRQNDAGLPVKTAGQAPATTQTPAVSETTSIDQTAQATPPAPAGATCERSAMVDITADLIDFNVNQNAWISSMLLYKLGLFGMDWDNTPWLDNKASFQRGVNQAIRRTTIELVDGLGRVRGTSGINANLQQARSNMQFDETAWYFGLDPFGPKTPTPSFYRSAMRDLRAFNDSLIKCESIFDARSDNLIEFLDRVSNDLGSTSAVLRERSENYNGGFFDTRADDRYWFAYGQLYGYYGVMSGTGADFNNVIEQRGLKPIWTESMRQLRKALDIQPLIISNAREDGIFATHLATMGFYVLRVRSNLVEMRDILAR